MHVKGALVCFSDNVSTGSARVFGSRVQSSQGPGLVKYLSCNYKTAFQLQGPHTTISFQLVITKAFSTCGNTNSTCVIRTPL